LSNTHQDVMICSAKLGFQLFIKCNPTNATDATQAMQIRNATNARIKAASLSLQR